jgi:hypothetical protein
MFNDKTRVQVKQITDYPNTGRVRIFIDPSTPSRFSLRLRKPRWSKDFSVQVNGNETALDDIAGGVEIERKWTAGDQLDINMPMQWHWVRGIETNAGLAALMRGPMVYCLSRERNQLDKDMVLRDIVLDPATLSEPQPDASCRPNGLAVRVKGWSPNTGLDTEPDLALLLTEFADPTGEEIYFRLSNKAEMTEDELVMGN